MSEQGQLHSNVTFGKVPPELIHDQEITHGAVRCYAHMHWRYGANHRNFEGQQSMAEFLGVSATTIHNWIDELAAKDWVIVVYRGFNKKTGNFTTPFYHVFEMQEECRQFRITFEAPEGQTVAGKPAPRERKLRRGVGGNVGNLKKGKTMPDRLNLSSDGQPNLSSDGGLNSGSDGLPNLGSEYLDSSYPDSIYPDTGLSVSGETVSESVQPSFPLKEKVTSETSQGKDPIPSSAEPLSRKAYLDEMFEAIATVWNTRAGGWIGNMRAMMLGEAKKGDWKAANFNPPATPSEVLDFGKYMTARRQRDRIVRPVTTPSTIQRWFYDYRASLHRAVGVPAAIKADPTPGAKPLQLTHEQSIERAQQIFGKEKV